MLHAVCDIQYVTYCSLFSELAAHAESIKIDGIAVLAPMYYKCADIESLVEYLAGKTWNWQYFIALFIEHIMYFPCHEKQKFQIWI